MKINNERFKPIMTEDQFDGIHREVDKAKGKKVTVDKASLEALLSDHSSLWALLGIGGADA